MVEVPLADLVTTVLERCQAVLSVAKYLFTSAQIKELFRKDYFQKYGWSRRNVQVSWNFWGSISTVQY